MIFLNASSRISSVVHAVVHTDLFTKKHNKAIVCSIPGIPNKTSWLMQHLLSGDQNVNIRTSC